MKLILALMLSLFMTNAMGQEYTSPFNHSLMAEKYYDLIVGESSGDRAFYHILDIAPYERDRKAEDYKGLFMESKYVVDKLKSYGFADATTELLGKTKTWDGVSATLWEVSPNTSKLADYRDLAAILAQGSNSAHVTTPCCLAVYCLDGNFYNRPSFDGRLLFFHRSRRQFYY